MILVQIPGQLQAVALRHADVRDDKVGTVLFHLYDGLHSIGRLPNQGKRQFQGRDLFY